MANKKFNFHLLQKFGTKFTRNFYVLPIFDLIVKQDYAVSRSGMVWREMIFDFVIFIAVAFFCFNYLRRGGGYVDSFWCNAIGVGATATVEVVVQVC